MLSIVYSRYESVIAFSATLKPFDYYAALCGFDANKVMTGEFGSPFMKSNRKLIIIPQVSTKMINRERNYSKIADAVHKIVELRRGNYLVLFPSFSFLEQVVACFHPNQEYRILRQGRLMRQGELDVILGALRDGRRPTLVFAVQGGMLAEGIDYPGETLIGVFVVGPPLPNVDREREEMRKYYQKKYGYGFDYTYIYPAMAKAVQAAGRVIRSETDRGLIVLLDERFLQLNYVKAMPSDWFEKSVTELVSQNILEDVKTFWQVNESQNVAV